MKILEYLKDRAVFLTINLILFFIILLIMLSVEFSIIIISIIFIVWFTPITIYISLEFVKSKKYYDELNNICENLDKKYLLSEVIKKPSFIEGKIITEILKETNRNMREHINHYKYIQSEYQEYIETWVHEIKTPIASSMLLIENYEDSIPFTMKSEVKKIEDYVDQVLYYSRSNDVSKDYIIKDFNLENIVRKTIKRNASDFINKKISIDIENIKGSVYSDPKWVEFILNQIISNAIKYSKKSSPKIIIYSIEKENNIILTIKDNGIGINEKDVNRVFEKGFTGENGRKFGKSTGIGLYLCKKLCSKLGIGIYLTSIENEGSEISIVFPTGKENLVHRSS